MAEGARHLGHIELILHELRTPVNVAAGSIAQLLEPDMDPVTAAQHPVILRAARACSQLEQLCEDLRDWAQLAGGTPMVTPTPLAPALKEAAKSAETTRRDTVHLVLPGDQRQDWRVLSPPGLLVRALTGILTACLRTAPDRASIPVVVDDDPARHEHSRPRGGDWSRADGRFRGRTHGWGWFRAAACPRRDRIGGRPHLVLGRKRTRGGHRPDPPDSRRVARGCVQFFGAVASSWRITSAPVDASRA